MVKKTSKSKAKEEGLCVLHDDKKLKAELFRDGEGFQVRFDGRGKDRSFESLPELMKGLHGIFLEIRMKGQGIHGLDGLAKASDDARQDVLAASRKIHAAIGTA